MNLSPVTTPGTRPMYWSVRRELWEYRLIYLAPSIVAAIFLFGHFLGSFHLARLLRDGLPMDASHLTFLITRPYHLASSMILLTAFLVGMFYSLDALNGERRDRSILFWKSLPVSDRVTVLSKAAIPLLFLPMVVFAIILATEAVMVILSSAALLLYRVSPAEIWSRLHWLQMWLALLYTIAVIALWHAPVYAWLLLISAWTRRAPLLWALLPLVAIPMFEWMAFRTRHFADLMAFRVYLGLGRAFGDRPGFPMDLSHLTPGRFLGSTGLWIGLAFAALVLFAAIRVRRRREPS
jgi:ABC-2 type transport system permease protein